MANERRQITTTLLQFYNQPVARVSLELLLSVGTVIFFAIFAIRPTLLTMADLIKEIEDKQALDTQLGQKVAALGSAQSEFLVLQNRLVVLDEAIPSTPNLVHSIKIIEKAASDHKLVINAMSVPEIPAETAADPNDMAKLQRQNLPLTLSLQGEYPAIRQFIEDLRASRRTFVVESVTFSVDEQKNQRTLLSTITLGLPYFGNSVAK